MSNSENILNFGKYKSKSKWYKDASSVFFEITGFGIVVGVCSDIYSVLCKKFPWMKPYNMYVFYSVAALFLICNIAFIVNSWASIHKLRRERDKIPQREYQTKMAMETLSFSTALLYSMKGMMGLLMSVGFGKESLAKFNLWICILAPVFDLVCASFRVVDIYQYHDDVKGIKAKGVEGVRVRINPYNNPDFALSCVNWFLSIFTLVCAVKEIVALNGHSEGTYDYADMDVIYMNIALGCLFLITFALGKYLDNRRESISRQKLESENNNDVPPNAERNGCYAVTTEDNNKSNPFSLATVAKHILNPNTSCCAIQ